MPDDAIGDRLRWWQWTKEHELQACRFFASYSVVVFRGGRKHWETVTFWIVAVAVVLSAFNPDALPRLLATWGMSSPEGLGIVPFYTVLAYIACRIALTPLWLYRDSVNVGREQLAGERARHEADISELSAKLVTDEDTSGRDEFVVLAGQLSQFLNARREDYDSQLGDPMEEIAAQVQDSLDSNAFGGPGKRMRTLAATRRSHDNSTLREYGDRFASRVIAASRRLRELGMNNATTACLGKYPTTIADIEAVIRELEAASTALPSIRAPETAEERYWNLRTQAEGPELAMKILRGANTSPVESKPNPEFDFAYSSANSLFDPPRSDTYRLRLFNRAEATTVDDVRVRVMSIPTDKQWAGVLPVGLRAQHGGEAPFTLNGTSPLLIDLLEYSAEKLPQVVTTWSEVGNDGQRQTMSRLVQYMLLCTDSLSPQVIIECGEGKVHDITIEVQGRNIQTCLKTFRVRSLLPNRGADGGALEITEV